MKIKVYGYYNYENIHDQKEHITVTPIKDVDISSRNDYSGNVYEFEYDGKIPFEYGTKYDKYMECDVDYFIDKDSRQLIQVNPEKYGYNSWKVVSKNGFCYLRIDDGHESPEYTWINLGNLKAHKIKE